MRETSTTVNMAEGAHLECLHRDKQVPKMKLSGKGSCFSPGNQRDCVDLKWLDTNAWRGNKEQLEVSVKLQGDDLTGVADTAHTTSMMPWKCRSTDLDLFRDLLGRTSCWTLLKRKGVQVLVAFQGSPPADSGTAHPRVQEVCRDEQGAPATTQTEQGSMQEVEQGQVTQER